MLRRWYVAAPFFLATVIAALFVVATVKPDYQATSYVQMIPPTVRPDDVPRGTTTASGHNPWADLGQDALGQAAVVIASQPDTARMLAAKGLTPNYTITMDDRSPIVVINATGRTEQQAIETARELAAEVTAQVMAQQTPYGLPQNQLITTRTLGSGETVEAVTTALKRTLIVVVAVGLIFTAAITIGFDAFVRRRARRRQGTPDAPAWPADGLPPSGNPRTPIPRASGVGRGGLSGVAAATRKPSDPIITNVVLPVSASTVAARASHPDSSGVTITYHATIDSDRSSHGDSEPRTTDMQLGHDHTANGNDDSTIILPLANPLRTGPER
jgi:hypothetical protein